MSVDIEKLIVEAGHDPRAYVVQPPFIGAVYFTAETLREFGLKVGYEPLDGLPFHGGVWGIITKGMQRQLGAKAQTYVPIPGLLNTGDC